MDKITEEEKRIVRSCLALALSSGAKAARISLDKTTMDICSLRDGEIDNVKRSADVALTFSIFADGRFGTYSTNRMDEDSLRIFIPETIAMTHILAPDKFRRLPDAERLVRNAITGLEEEMYDPARESLTPEQRIELARKASGHGEESDAYKVVSEETEYSDTLYDTYMIDSQGLECRHIETSFDIGSEVTVQAPDGSKLSGYAWDSRTHLKDLELEGCARKATEHAARQIGPQHVGSGKYNVVIVNEESSKVVSPLLSALGAYSIQQHNSFLEDSLGKQVFPEGFTLTDTPLAPGCPGARLFDSEGVALSNTPIIEKGIVKEYFVNTYMAGKTGFAPTTEAAARPVMSPYLRGEETPSSLDCKGIMEKLGDGILVTGFNGGNSNSATGDFSYGIEGFVFRGGKIAFPVREMVMTGNFISLWKGLVAAGTDARPCMTKVIPTLAFKGVDISA